MIDTILILHLIGAGAAALFVLASMYQIATRKGSLQASKVTALGLIVYQSFTGIVLMLLSPNVSLASICVRGLVFVAVVGIAHASVSFRFTSSK